VSDASAIERLDAVPGIGRRTAEVVVGTDMGRFPPAAHLASWATLCPGNNESGGKRLTGRTRKASPGCARCWSGPRRRPGAHGSTLRAHHQRLAAAGGSKRATVAVAHRLLLIVYRLPRDPTAAYWDGFPQTSRGARPQAARRRLVRRLEALGYAVAVSPAA
jgi:transposase